MGTKRIGEFLGELVPLSRLDVEEILNEQAASRRPFGDIAISMRLCEPQDIWKAWCRQLAETPSRIKLSTFGVDSHAVSLVPSRLAREFGIIPVRVLGDVLIVAVSPERLREASEMLSCVKLDMRFVLAGEEEIQCAIATYYPQLETVR